MKNRIPLNITLAIIAVAIIIVCLGMSGIFLPNETTHDVKPPINGTPVFKNIDNPNREISASPELLKELRSLNFRSRGFGINNWEFGPHPNEITLYVNDIKNQSEILDLQGKQLGNYTIHIIHDTEFEDTRTEVIEQLRKLQKDTKYQIAMIEMSSGAFGDPPGNFAEVWVYQLTPENKKLDGTVMNGWTILVYPASS